MGKKIESLYLHFPFCKHLCNYCDFYKKVPQNASLEITDFHNYLNEGFVEHEKLIKVHGYSWVPLKTLYIGGGTPSLWGVEGKNFLKDFLENNGIVLADNCEFTLEVNPGSWTSEVLAEWEKLGVNRYSLGIQSLDGKVLKNLDRVHSVDDVYETLNFFFEKKVNFSVDFMLGLPYSKENCRNVLDELERVLKFNPKHFSVYILTVKNNYTHYKNLPTEEWIEKEYLEVSEYLRSHGYNHYEVSNFALPGFESRHNLSYWRSNTVAALGPSATGFLAEIKLRYKWKTKEAKMETESISEEEYRLEQLYMSLRSEGLNLKALIIKDQRWAEVGRKWSQQGLVELSPFGHLSLTSNGYLLLDSLMNDLFALKLETT